MLSYLITGLVLGSAYAITATGVTMTLVSAGVLNFAFGSMAFVVDRFYYYLLVQLGWPILPSALMAILVLAPLMGLLLWLVLFRNLRARPPLIRIVATIGLSVALPAVVELVFGNGQLQSTPGLAPEPVRVFQFLGATITLDEVYVLISLVVVGVLGVVIIRFTDIGLRVRAMVDSEAMTSLSGTNPATISALVWVVSSLLAGLVGVVLGPILGLDITAFTLMMAASFAAVIVARLRNVGIAAIIGLLLGAANGVVDRYVPASSSLKPIVVNSLPFVFILAALIYNLWRSDVEDVGDTSGALDIAIRSDTTATGDNLGATRHRTTTMKEAHHKAGGLREAATSNVGALGVMVVIAILPLVLRGLWLAQVGVGMAFAIAFLSFTLVTGEGGMIWLCEITFAGFGAVISAYLFSHGWPVLLAIGCSALLVVPVGLLVGYLTARLGSLYVALVTLTFAFLIDNLVFSLNVFSNDQTGVPLGRPSFTHSNIAFAYLTFGIFCILALIIFNLRKSSAGLALSAARSSDVATRMLGFNVIGMRVLVSGAAAFVAAVGGGLLACSAGLSIPTSYATLGGLVWLAVLVTIGVRSTAAAAVAGLLFALMPVVFENYLPVSIASLPTALFGLGAVLVVRNPNGVAALHARQLRDLELWVKRRFRSAENAGTADGAFIGQLHVSEDTSMTTSPAVDDTSTATSPVVSDPELLILRGDPQVTASVRRIVK